MAEADLPEGLRQCESTPVVVQQSRVTPATTETFEEVRDELAAAGATATALEVEAAFTDDCPLAVQEEADRIRDYLHAADFIGATRLRLTVTEADNEKLVADALKACQERGTKCGVELEVAWD